MINVVIDLTPTTSFHYLRSPPPTIHVRTPRCSLLHSLLIPPFSNITMGCCVSTKKPTETTPPQLHLPPKDLNLHLLDRALVPESDPPSIPNQTPNTTIRKKSPPPPPPPFEEESVKEVLSETPSLKPNYPKFHDHQKILRLPSFPRIEQHHNKNAHFEEISEVSEICSVSESVSTSAITEQSQSRDFDEVLQHQPRIFDHSPSKIRRKRSDSGELIYSRGGSPVRRSVPQQQNRQWNQNGVLRDHGESSRRRSRSPAGVSRPGMSPSPSKRGVRYSGRNPTEINRNFEEAKDGKRPVKESLEDPLVSLECFIFL